MYRFAAVLALAGTMLVADGAFGQDPAKVKAAAVEFDAGATAYKAKDFEAAASHFESADALVPSAKSLRQAIRARVEGGQGSRAATLSAQALDRYPTDEATAKLAKETLEKLEPLLQKVKVSCGSPCVLASGTRAIPGESNTRWVVYFDPGDAELSASFVGQSGGGKPKKIAAKAGSSIDLRFDPEEKKTPPVVVPPPATSKPDPVPDLASPPPAADTAEKGGWGLPPAVFFVGLLSTAAVGGVTIWSAIDTKSNPGQDVVRQACAGKGESCPEYQDGLARQNRTNILIGATAGTAGLTAVIGLFFTNWKGKAKKDAPPEEKKDSARFVAPFTVVTDRGAFAGARGAF